MCYNLLIKYFEHKVLDKNMFTLKNFMQIYKIIFRVCDISMI